jgi:fructose-bisphosphate aldolase, class II
MGAQPMSVARGRVEGARDLMRRTRAEGFSVGAFNVDNLETLVAIARAAWAKSAPVLVEASHSEVESIGLANLRDLVDNYREELGIEMYLNLDHSPSVETARAGIEAGFEFVHIDYSQANRDASEDAIIAATKEVVAAARDSGALIESEPRYFHGSSNLHDEAIDYEEVKATFSTPDGARDFVEETGIDTFAAAVGNLHGKYPTPKRLDLDLLRRIRAAIDVNISLHGGSGTPGHYFEEAARIGVSKVNLNSDLRYAYRTNLEKVLAENPDEYALVRLMDPVIAAVQEVVEDHIDLYGSTGKAKP